MNLISPHCRRCDGEKFLHVRAMPDAASTYDGTKGHVSTWERRPVRFVDTGKEKVALGYFSTLICRQCGLTEWYAMDWHPAGDARRQACRECKRDTMHGQLQAIEHAHGGFEAVRITHGLLGREGFLYLSICHQCGLTDWHAREYQHLEPRHLVHYRLAHDHERRCLACGDDEALIDDRIREYEKVAAPIAVNTTGALAKWVGLVRCFGHFEVRVCRPCGVTEWYAHGHEGLTTDEELGIEVIGDAPPSSMGGPYR